MSNYTDSDLNPKWKIFAFIMSSSVIVSAKFFNLWLPKDEKEIIDKDELNDFKKTICKRRTSNTAELNMASWGMMMGWIFYAIGFFTPLVSAGLGSLLLLITNMSVDSTIGRVMFNWYYPLVFVLGTLGTYFMVLSIRTGKKERALARSFYHTRDTEPEKLGSVVMSYAKDTDKPTNVRIIVYTTVAFCLGLLLIKYSIL